MSAPNLIEVPPTTKPTTPIADDPLKYISASRLKCFQTCRLQYYFRYIATLPTTLSPALLVGRIVHAVLQAWNLARWRGEDASVDCMQQVFETRWEEGCDDDSINWKPDQRPKEKVKAWSILDHFLNETEIPLAEKPVAVEVKVERDLKAHGLPPLLGIIDLVRPGGKIVDFKTAARTPTPAMAEFQNEIQLGCYALLYREATGEQETGFELHHLIKTKEPKIVVTAMDPMEPRQIRNLVTMMESYVSGVMAEDFVPSRGQHCSWCDYYLGACSRWQSGGQE